jgi:hypothetical protein
MDKNVTSLTIFMEKGGNPIKVRTIYRREGRNSPRLLSSGLLWNFAKKSNAVNTIAFVSSIVNYVNAIENIHSLIIPQGYYYINTAKINGCNSDT